MTTRTMKRFGIVLATAAVAVGSASMARADDEMTLKVPFAFIAGDTKLPAGNYVVRNMADGSGIVAIVSADGRNVAMLPTIASSPSEARYSRHIKSEAMIMSLMPDNDPASLTRAFDHVSIPEQMRSQPSCAPAI